MALPIRTLLKRFSGMRRYTALVLTPKIRAVSGLSAANREVFGIIPNTQQRETSNRKRQKTDGCWPQLHGNLTPAHTDGCAAQCFEGVQRGSLIILSVHPRPQIATPVSRPGFVAHLFGRGPVLRTCNRVMAHRPTGSTQTDRIRLPYAARRLSLSRDNKALSACKSIPSSICFYGTTNSP